MWRLVLAAMLLAACAAQSPPELSVKVYQTRSDTPLGKIEIQVRNDGPQPLTVQRAELRSDRLDGPAVWERPVDVPAGYAMDLKVDLPAPRCDGPVVDEVLLVVDGQDLRMPAADPLGQLSKYIERRCFEQAVAQTAVIEVERVTDSGLDVMVSPGAATVGRLGSTILFAPVDDESLAAAPGSPAGTRTVALRPNRCDAHALGEDKQGTYFGVEVALPDGRAGTYTFGVDRNQRAQLYRLYARQCRLS